LVWAEEMLFTRQLLRSDLQLETPAI
jgi:hypothetical protein